MIALRFTEWLEGRVALGETACEIGAWSGEPLALQLTLSTSDLEKFDASADRLLQVEGEIRYRPLGGRLSVRGTVNQLVDVAGGSWLARRLAPLRFYSGFIGKLWQVYGIDPGRRR